MFAGKTLLITGGTGSFGTAVLRKLVDYDFKEIRIFSRDEKKQDDMRQEHSNPKLKFVIGDVRDYGAVLNSMRGVDFVFHAAALKQVPSCEFYPMEAVKTNVFGTENVVEAAISCEVERVICLSTDKAVYPINAMGISKSLMEKVVTAKARVSNNTIICTTRYGNVIGSRGSVVPLFMQQLAAKKPITITDPKMTRFLMSLSDAVNLVLFAFDHGQPGDIFVQKSPSATIENLALAVSKFFGEGDCLFKTIGTRHGEKLFETLLSREEMVVAEEFENYYRVPADIRDLNYNNFIDRGFKKITHSVDYNSHNATQLNVAEIVGVLKNLNLAQGS